VWEQTFSQLFHNEEGKV